MIIDVGITQLTKKTNENFGSMMWVLQDGNVIKCNLTIMEVSITWLAKNTNKKFGTLIRVLQDKNTIKCNMKYPYADIACPNKWFVYYHYFIFFAQLSQQNLNL